MSAHARQHDAGQDNERLQKLDDTGLTLRSGPAIFDDQGWRFPLRDEDDPDESYDGFSVLVLVVAGDDLL